MTTRTPAERHSAMAAGTLLMTWLAPMAAAYRFSVSSDRVGVFDVLLTNSREPAPMFTVSSLPSRTLIMNCGSVPSFARCST